VRFVVVLLVVTGRDAACSLRTFGSRVGRQAHRAAAGRGRRADLLVVRGDGARHLAFGIELFPVTRPRLPVHLGRHPHHRLAGSEHSAEHLLGFVLAMEFLFALRPKLGAGQTTQAVRLLVARKGGSVIVDHRNVGRVSPSTLLATTDWIALTVDIGSRSWARTRTNTEAVVLVPLVITSRMGGRTTLTRASSTASNWLMVRASSSCNARWYLTF
jgi:hypothetical protein